MAYSGEQSRTYQAGGHRIRHYGLFANGNRTEKIARVRELLAVATVEEEVKAEAAAEPGQSHVLPRLCPCCGGRMIVIEVFARGCEPMHRPAPVTVIRIDTS